MLRRHVQPFSCFQKDLYKYIHIIRLGTVLCMMVCDGIGIVRMRGLIHCVSVD